MYYGRKSGQKSGFVIASRQRFALGLVIHRHFRGAWRLPPRGRSASALLFLPPTRAASPLCGFPRAEKRPARSGWPLVPRPLGASVPGWAVPRRPRMRLHRDAAEKANGRLPGRSSCSALPCCPAPAVPDDSRRLVTIFSIFACVLLACFIYSKCTIGKPIGIRGRFHQVKVPAL